MGTDRDPVRGSAALACKARLEDKGIDCHVCDSEQDFHGILLARQAELGGGMGMGAWDLKGGV